MLLVSRVMVKMASQLGDILFIRFSVMGDLEDLNRKGRVMDVFTLLLLLLLLMMLYYT